MSVALKMHCPHPACDGYGGDAKQWYKSSCGHSERIDTNVDVYCTQQSGGKCRWSNGNYKLCILDLRWKCDQCKHKHKKADKEGLLAAVGQIMASLTCGGGIDDKRTASAIVMKLIEKAR